MPRYHFATCGVAGQDFVLLDPAGSVLEDGAAATFYARKLARGIKKKTMVHLVGWTIVVRESECDVCFLHIGLTI